MRKISLILGLSLALLFGVGCTTGMDYIDYNNAIVDHFNPTLDAVEVSADSYDVSVPDTVYEDSTIDLVAMESAYTELKEKIDYISSDLLLLESQNKEQETAVRTALTDYYTKGTVYVTGYREMIDYYTDDFGSDLDQVAILDEKLYNAYNDLVDSHNALVDVLELF
ncbi:MAG: hypothetical protein WCW30_05240 [Candidatus Gracilibacteria bacterium]|jgi:hypothetical protein